MKLMNYCVHEAGMMVSLAVLWHALRYDVGFAFSRDIRHCCRWLQPFEFSIEHTVDGVQSWCKCSLPYMREVELSERLGRLLRDIRVPETIAQTIVDSLRTEVGRSETQRVEQVAAIQQRLATIRTRMDQIYEDKLDGKIDEQLWERKQSEYREQERSQEASLSSMSKPITKDNVLTVERVFELANKAHFLYLTRNSAERGQLLKSVLLNCSTDGVSLWPTYKKPFDMIFLRARNEDWSGRADLNCRPLAPQASALPG
jgi:site-specific DNA recombinase